MAIFSLPIPPSLTHALTLRAKSRPLLSIELISEMILFGLPNYLHIQTQLHRLGSQLNGE
jgi:hypothetical protein